MIESLKRLRALRAQGAKIFYGHDPEFWKEVPQLQAL
jgi:glyoxylase-like metal-dependent hydrolase (beta-lactamase superfamily II)